MVYGGFTSWARTHAKLHLQRLQVQRRVSLGTHDGCAIRRLRQLHACKAKAVSALNAYYYYPIPCPEDAFCTSSIPYLVLRRIHGDTRVHYEPECTQRALQGARGHPFVRR